MEINETHIGLYVAEDMPQQILRMYETELDANGLNLKIIKFPFQVPYCCIEWTLPTIVGVYILKSYFECFLQETSKDHYRILKKWLQKTAINLRSIKVYKVTADHSPDKIDKHNTQSRVFSINTVSNTGEHLKFLFDDTLSDEEWQKGIELLLDLLKEHFCNGKNDKLSIEIKNNSLTEREIYCRLKTNKIDWEILDYRKIIKEDKDKREDISDTGNNIS